MHPKLCKVGTKKMQHTRFYAVKNVFLLIYALKGQCQAMLYETIKTIEIFCKVQIFCRYQLKLADQGLDIYKG